MFVLHTRKLQSLSFLIWFSSFWELLCLAFAPHLLTPSNHKWWCIHDDVIKWKDFPRYWPFVRRIHRSPVNSPHKGRWRRPLMFSLICAWIDGWANSHEGGDLRRHRVHYNVILMMLGPNLTPLSWQYLPYYASFYTYIYICVCVCVDFMKLKIFNIIFYLCKIILIHSVSLHGSSKRNEISHRYATATPNPHRFIFCG